MKINIIVEAEGGKREIATLREDIQKLLSQHTCQYEIITESLDGTREFISESLDGTGEFICISQHLQGMQGMEEKDEDENEEIIEAEIMPEIILLPK